MSVRFLERLLSPRSVAVFGASDRPGAVGTTVWRNLRSGGFAGPVWPVNPHHAELDGVRCMASADGLAEAPDLAVICTPPATVAALVAQLGSRGTRAAAVITAGLSASQRDAMLQAARPHTMRLLGPNCIGLLSPHVGLNASFAHIDARPGRVAFVSQSGALVTAMLDWARARGVGLSHLVSLGDHCDVDFGDLLDYLASDPRTRAILLYIESIESPRKFMSAARAAARNKPVIVVKAGRDGHGVRAAASHTGALAGSDVVYDAAIRRAGMLRVDTLQELFLAAETLAHFADNRDDCLSIVTNGGGAGVMAADAAAREGVTVPELAPALERALDEVLPANWSRGNPVDLIGDAPVARYTQALTRLLADRSAGALLFIHAPTALVPSDDIARACLPLARAAAPRVMSCWLGDQAVREARRLFDEAGLPTYDTPEDAVHAFGLLQTYRRNQASLMQVPEAGADDGGASAGSPAARVRPLLEAALRDGREWLDADEVAVLLQAYGIPAVPTLRMPLDAEGAVAGARALGYPVALKIASRVLTHKSDVGGVVLDLADEAALRAACERMLHDVRAARPDAPLDGFLLQPMVRRPGAQELIVGASIDALFGPVILCGQGGTGVELVRDTAIALPPLDRHLAGELLSRTRVSRLLGAWRGRPAARSDQVEDVLVAVSRLLAECDAVRELDINPLAVDAQGVMALDARVRVDAARPAGAARFAILPYPREWVREVDWQGRRLRLRPIRPEDAPAHRRFIAGLDPEDVRLRVFHARRELLDTELARLTQIDYDREMAFVAQALPEDGARAAPGEPHLVGVARSIGDPDGVEAEFAVIVDSRLKGRGLGGLLLDLLIEHARARGRARLFGDVLRENLPMRALCRSRGFEAHATEDGSVERMTLRLDLRR